LKNQKEFRRNRKMKTKTMKEFIEEKILPPFDTKEE
jgi:hypothetical protein